MIEKHILRKEILEKRKSLSEKEIRENSEQIRHTICENLDFLNKNIHIYTQCRDGEIDTTTIIETLLTLTSNIFSSHTHFQTKTLEHYNISSHNIYHGTYDYIFVPGIVFDERKNRIGYGYGFYDKFLSNHPDSTLIGVCHDFQIVKLISTEKHDIALDLIYSEKRVIR